MVREQNILGTTAVCVVLSHNRVQAFDVLTVRYWLDGPGIESRWGEIFRTHSDRSCGAPSLLYNGYQVCFPGVERPWRGLNGYQGCFPGVERPWRGLNHPPPLSPMLKKE